MFTLIKNEIYKIFHKKSTYIVLIICMAFILLITGLSKYLQTHDNSFIYGASFYDEDNMDEVSRQTYKDYQDKLAKYNPDTWQYNYITTNDYYSIAYNYYSSLSESSEEQNFYKEIYDKTNKALAEDNWQYLVKEEITDVKAQIASIKNQEAITKQDEANLFSLNAQLDCLEYRLNESVSYNNDYLNEALQIVINNASSTYKYEHTTNKEEKEYTKQEAKSYYESKYVLDTKEDINNDLNLRSLIIEFFTNYFFLILVFVIMISGAIVSDEYNKGTIKSLLITPYKRSTILLAKYITTLIMVLFIIAFMLVFQIVVGGIILGFGSLKVSYVVYNLTTKSLEIINLFKYFLLVLGATLPQIILLATLAFALSTILANTAFAIAITFCGVIGSSIINMLASAYKLKFLNYFVTTNWDFNLYLFGNNNIYGNSVTHAIIVCLVYYLIMIITTFIVFKRKNIKNI